MMIELNAVERMAVTTSGEKFIVIQRDLDRRKIHARGNLLAYKEGTRKARFDEIQTFNEWDVIISDVSTDGRLLDALFRQTRRSSGFKTPIMSGDMEVTKVNGVYSIQKAPKASVRIDDLKCPRHDVNMRVQRNPKGGFFAKCPTRSETGCNITCSLDGKFHWSDPDGYFTVDTAAE
jgi:hypothetical protein